MSAHLQPLITIASALAATALNALWEDALLVVCVWLALRAWPRVNAATRHAAWSATLVAALVVPIATTLAFFTPSQPSAAVTERAAVQTQSVLAARPRTLHAVPQRPLAPVATSNVPATLPAASVRARLHLQLPIQLTIAVAAIWALLAIYALVRLFIGLLRLEQLKRDALPLPVEYRDSMPQWTNANKGHRPVRLCVSDDVDVPVAIGLFDSMILIPRVLLEQMSPGEVEQISLHELAHLRRADDWSNCAQRLIVAVLGWNPAALFIEQQLELEREVACDDWVLSLVPTVRPYAQCLTKMAESAAWPHHPMPAPGVFTTRKQISQRIERLLGAGRNIATNLSLGPTAGAIAVVGAVALVIAVVAPSVAAPTIAAGPIASSAATAAAKAAATAAPAIANATAKSSAKAAAQAAAQAPGVHTTVVVKTVAQAAAAVPAPPKPPAPQTRTEYMTHVAGAPEVQAMVQAKMGMALAERATKAALASVPGLSSMVSAKGNERSCVGCDYSGVNWSGRDLHGATYTGVDLTKANLSGVNFSNSSMNGVDFSGANLSGVNFAGAHLTGCDFTRADLNGANFTGAWMSGCEFSRARMESAQMRDVLNGCKGCSFAKADLAGADLRGVRINGDDFEGADLRNVNFAGAQIVGADFSHARLDGANLAGATLTECDLDGVNLSHVDLSRTKMIGTDLSNDRNP